MPEYQPQKSFAECGLRSLEAMSAPVFDHDETSDTLCVSCAPGEAATGSERNEHILLRIDTRQRRVIGLTFFEYSVLAQRTEIGPRSFPLTGLGELSEELRTVVLEILFHPPVGNLLLVSAYTPSPSERIPITSLQLASTAG